MITLEVKLPDTPGSLIELIKPISSNGGNIFGILHSHDKKIKNMISVSITFEMNIELQQIGLSRIKQELSKRNILIETITQDDKKRQFIVILTGHVFDTDVVDTIKRLAAKKIKITELQARFTEIDEVSNVKLKLDFPESMTEKNVLNELQKICQEKKLFLIRS